MQTGKGSSRDTPADREHIIANRPRDPNWLGIGSESEPRDLVQPPDAERRDTSHKPGDSHGDQDD